MKNSCLLIFYLFSHSLVASQGYLVPLDSPLEKNPQSHIANQMHAEHRSWCSQKAAQLQQQQRMQVYGSNYVRYPLTHNAYRMLTDYNSESPLFEYCAGTPEQQRVHADIVDIVNRAGDLHTQSNGAAVRNVTKTVVECAEVAREYNYCGETSKASTLTEFCSTLLDFGTAIVRGIGTGIVTAGTDMLNHPVQTAVCVFAGEYVLAYQLCKVLFEVAQIGSIALTDRKEGAQRWQEYIAPLNSVIEAIEKKQFSLRDGIQGVTHFAVQCRLQNKLLGNMGTLYRGSRDQALNFVRKNPKAFPEQYMTTPEGVLFKVVGDAPSQPKIQKYSHLNKTTLWDIVKNNTGKTQYSFSGRLINLYRDTSEKYWWAKDITGHGGSHFKVFVKEGKIFKWVADADEYGNFIQNKHKSDAGRIIKT